jgi:non-ribosomal peptide synthetase component F/acyl carrier protein
MGDATTSRAVPRTFHEDAILEIWCDVLGRSDIDVSDDFFSFGDHSLVPIVVARIRKSLGVAIPVMDFLEYRTVAALAAAVAARSASMSGTVPRRPPDAEPVLSFDQQRIWMETQILPDGAYNNHARRRLVGPLDVGVIERSIRAIIGRHEALRSRFPTVADRAVQLVDDFDGAWDLRIADVSDVEDDRDGAAIRLLNSDATIPFDLTEGPLFRVLLVRLSDTEHILGLTLHQIISDSRSIYVFNRELAALYEAGGDPERANLSPLSIQYRDFAVWQRGALVGDTLERQVSYWRDHLAGAPPVLALPAARRRTADQSAESERVDSVFSREETVALHELCRAHDVTPFMVLLAALTTVLNRWTGQSDIVTGVAFEGRVDTEVDKLMGIFFNVLPMRTDLSGNPTFAELLARVRRVALDGFDHSQAPIDVVVSDLQVARDPRRTPVFEVVLNVTAPPEDQNVTGLAVESMGTSSPRTRFDLFINAQEHSGRIGLTYDFTADRFDPAMMRALADHLHALLRQATGDPTTGILDYPLQPGDADVGSEPAGRAAAPHGKPAPHRAVDSHARLADRTAVVDAHGRWSYRWLSRTADRIAADLWRREVRPGDRIGVVRRPTAGFVAAVLAGTKAGATVSVLDGTDPAGAASAGVSMLLDAGPAGVREPATIDLSPLLADEGDHGDPAPAGRPDETGQPDGSGSDRAVDWAVDRFGLGATDRFAVLSSAPGHLMSALHSAFAAGATLVLPDAATTCDVGALTAWLRSFDISVLYTTPSVVRVLAAQDPRPAFPALAYAFVDNSGEFLPHDVDALRALSPTCRCVGVYRVGADGRPLAVYPVPDDWQLQTAPLRVPLGVELPDRPARLLRPSGHPAAVGEIGEICFGPAHTGDVGRRWADGTLEFAHRLGANPIVDPVETAATLRDMPEVRDAVVVERQGPGSADGSTLLGYVAGPGSRLDTVGVHNFLRARLPGYLIPEHIFVLDALPRTADGDYDLAPLPVSGAESSTAFDYVAPRTPMERELTGIVMDLLNVERVGVHDSFFELGGFSMLATRLTARIRAAFNVEVALRDIFESPTVDELAKLIIHAQAELSGTDELEALLDEIEQSEPVDAAPGPARTDSAPPARLAPGG